MKVSIIMCSYNGSPLVQKAVESILNQTYGNWELIICDDKSTDNSPAILREYAAGDTRIKLYENEQNLGYVRNKNKAFTYATGELLTQIDCDDMSSLTRLEMQVAAFEKFSDLKICGSNFQVIDMQDKPLECKEYKEDFFIHFSSPHYPFWFPGLMFRRELFEETGNFSEYFIETYGDDHYWTYIVNQKYPIYFLKEPLYQYRRNTSSITNVYTNPRKLIVPEVLEELYRQRKETGTDYLEQDMPERMQEFEEILLNDKQLMAEKYRIWAAKAIDTRNWQQAKKLIKQSLKLRTNKSKALRTYLYYFRNRYMAKA